MDVTEERQQILDLLEEVCELAEKDELEFAREMRIIAQGNRYRIVGGGTYGWRSWADKKVLVCAAVAPGLKVRLGTLVCRIYYDCIPPLYRTWHCEVVPEWYEGGMNWARQYLSGLCGVPFLLRYRLNHALKPLVARVLRERAKKRAEADAEAKCAKRLQQEQAALKGMRGE